MIQKNHHKKVFLHLLAVLLLIPIFTTPIATHAVTVGPVKLEYSIDPGTSVSGEIYIKNEDDEEKVFYPSVEVFTEQNGQKVFPKEKSLISDWLTTEKSIKLKAGEGVKAPFTITVPQDAPPGGQFGVIWWGNVDPNATSTAQDVSIQTRAGILVYLNISGDTVEKASVEFGTRGNKSVFGSASVPFNLTVKNEGNVYIKPMGSLKVTSLFGTTVAEIPVNPKQLQILPNSFRVYDNVNWFGSKFSFGPYKTDLSIFYGKSDTPITTSQWVWIFPVKLIGIALGSIIVIFVLLTYFFRIYNRWLLKKFAAAQHKTDEE